MPLYLRPGEIHLGARDPQGDIARVLSRTCDVIEARVLKHQADHEIIGVPAREILLGGGNIHRITQQTPPPKQPIR
jgi:ornithine carbamoyltransferase